MLLSTPSATAQAGPILVMVHDPFDPFNDRSVERIDAGRTVTEILAARGISEFGVPTVCTLNGRPLLRALWPVRVVGPDDTVAFVPVLRGGGGGGGGSDPLRTVLMIAVIVAAAYFAPAIGGAFANAAAAGGKVLSSAALAGKAIGGALITFGGSMIVNALVPPPSPPSPSVGFSGGAALSAPSPTYTIQGDGNQARLGQPKPSLYGRHRIVPDFASQTWAEFVDNEQYIHMLYYLSQGYLDIEKKLIGNTATANFEEIEEEVIEPGGTLTLFDAAIVTATEVSGQTLEGPNELDEGEDGWIGPFPASSPGTICSKIFVDSVLPGGLYNASSGSLANLTVEWEVEVREIDDDGEPVGEGDWTLIGDESLTLADNTPQRRSDEYDLSAASLPDGRYEVRCRRANNATTSISAADRIDWHGLRAKLDETPNWGDGTLYALRARATNNLSAQSSRQVSIIATRKLPVWDSETETWSAPQATRSIVWAFCDVAKASYGGRLTDKRLDLPGLADLDAFYAARGDTFDGIFDSPTTVSDALATVARVGRAVRVPLGTRIRMVRDSDPGPAGYFFNMRNIRKGSFETEYLLPTAETADAVTIEYVNDTSWKPAEVTMRALGAPYEAWLEAEELTDSPSSRALWFAAAEEPVRVRLFGCTQYRMAREEAWYMAQSNVYRRRAVSFSTEAEGLLPAYGDGARIAHELPRWGVSGEVEDWDGDNAIATLTQPVTFADEATHYAGLSDGKGGFTGPYEVEPADEDETAGTFRIHFIDAPSTAPYTGGRKERTSFAFGPGDAWAVKAKLMKIRPRAGFRVELHLIIDHPEVYAAPPEEA